MGQPVLFDAWKDARAQWPGVVVTEEDFERFVSARTMPDESAGPITPRWSDLYLTCACARGDASAIAAFEEAHLRDLASALTVVTGPVAADEVRQRLREKLFVAPAGAPPKIAAYSGRGTLASWVRVAAVRTALDLAAQSPRNVPVDEETLALVVGDGNDPELLYFKRLYTEAFQTAFADAFRQLDARERSLLRFAFAEGLGVDRIGAIYGAHRATAARWIVKAHQKLGAAIKAALAAHLRVDEADVASILRLIQSQLDLSLGHVNGASDGD